MAARLTDRQKKKILADYVQTNNYCATAKINGVSATTVKNLVRANADIVEKCEQKKEENTVDVLAYMDAQRETVCQIIGKGLAALNDPEKLAEARHCCQNLRSATVLTFSMILSMVSKDSFNPRSFS